jgi:hypothetical protein
MPLYYFNVSDGATFLDVDGTEFAVFQEAKREAFRTSGELLREKAFRSASPLAEPWRTHWRIWVTDEPHGGGKTLFEFELSAKQTGD